MPMHDEIELLGERMEAFIAQLERLPEGVFLEKIDGWSARDIFAHLIGWMDLTVEGCDQILAGEVPAFYEDPGEDFANVNAQLVERYAARKLPELVQEQREAHARLIDYLRGVTPGEWQRDYGVRFAGGTETIRGLVTAVSEDYESHGEQIAAWLEGRNDG